MIQKKIIATTVLVPYDSKEGRLRFLRSLIAGLLVDFFRVSMYHEGQENITFCAVASIVAVYNALKLPNSSNEMPPDKTRLTLYECRHLKKAGYNEPIVKRATQNNIFSLLPKDSHLKTKLQVLGDPMADGAPDFGMTLRETHQFLKFLGLNSSITVVNDGTSNDKFIETLIKILKTKGCYVLANYSRKILGQKGGGHMSPVVGYDKQSHSFLILDVRTEKHEWVWANANELVNAMRTRTLRSVGNSNIRGKENRGFVVVEMPLPESRHADLFTGRPQKT